MLRAAVIFFIFAVLTLVIGATGFAGLSVDTDRMLVFAFLVLAVVSFLASFISRNPPRPLP
jgi:uncharacterized membrane protein YtjA (UPF0391 family)